MFAFHFIIESSKLFSLLFIIPSTSLTLKKLISSEMDYLCKYLDWKSSYKRKGWRKGIYQWLCYAAEVI